MKEEKANIRNSTIEFLTFTEQSGEDSIEVRIEEESIWLTQKLMGILFEVSLKTINEHSINLLDQKEILQRAKNNHIHLIFAEVSITAKLFFKNGDLRS